MTVAHKIVFRPLFWDASLYALVVKKNQYAAARPTEKLTKLESSTLLLFLNLTVIVDS